MKPHAASLHGFAPCAMDTSKQPLMHQQRQAQQMLEEQTLRSLARITDSAYRKHSCALKEAQAGQRGALLCICRAITFCTVSHALHNWGSGR